MPDREVSFLRLPAAGEAVHYMVDGNLERGAVATSVEADPDDSSLFHVSTDDGQRFAGRVVQAGSLEQGAPPPPRPYPEAGRRKGSPAAVYIVAGVVGCGGCALVAMALMAAILFPVFARAREAARKATCMNNIRQVQTAFLMYASDYDDCLPSSALNGAAASDPTFCTVYDPGAKRKSAAKLLSSYVKGREVWFCPSDSNNNSRPDDVVSYYYRACVDQGAMDGHLKLKQFVSPAEQAVFVDRLGSHTGDAARGWAQGVVLTTAFLDGHVGTLRLDSHSSGLTQPEVTGRLKWQTPGAPMYYSFDAKSGKPVKGALIDPRRYTDRTQLGP